MADKNKYKNSKEEIVKPSKSMMVDTTTGEGANIFLIKQKKKINNSKDYIKTLWECCQIPDFSKKAYGNHINIVKTSFHLNFVSFHYIV